MPLACSYWFTFFFLQFRDGISEAYDSLFGQSSGDGSYSRAANFNKRYGWYSSIYALAQSDITRFEDITKLNVHQCFTMLSFMKEKSEIEAQQIKNKF